TTRLLVNSAIEEAVCFKEGPSMEDEFLRTYPLKTIARLNGLDEDGTFVVAGSIIGYETCFSNDPRNGGTMIKFSNIKPVRGGKIDLLYFERRETS
ncbi:replication factor A protein, partial [Trifolium medium]|nr:replication factor A protein [Trifolium medium]